MHVTERSTCDQVFKDHVWPGRSPVHAMAWPGLARQYMYVDVQISAREDKLISH